MQMMRTAQVHEALQASKLFGPLPELERAALAQRLEIVPVQAGAQLYQEGDAGDSLYIVLMGRLRVSRAGSAGNLMLYNELRPGECIGVAALMLQQQRTASL